MTAEGTNKARWVRCPACGKPALYGVENLSRPFCSARCRSADLGAWASESYRMASDTPSESDDAEPMQGAAH